MVGGAAGRLQIEQNVSVGGRCSGPAADRAGRVGRWEVVGGAAGRLQIEQNESVGGRCSRPAADSAECVGRWEVQRAGCR